MNKGIFLFNIIYYVVTFIFIKKGVDDPSSSLGYGYFIIIFWAAAMITLIILLIRKTIQPKSVLDKVGIFTVTPVLSIVFITFMLAFKEKVSSEWYFTKENYRYKVVTYDYHGSSVIKRIEYYKSGNTLDSNRTLANDLWLKDSTWIYLSKVGDTIKKVRYKDNLEVK